MKHHYPLRGGRAIILGLACLGLSVQLFAQNKEIPRGTLTVESTLVQAGAEPQITWQVQYPESVTDIIEAAPQLTLSEDELQMRVRILGSELTPKNNNDHVKNLAGMDSGKKFAKMTSKLGSVVNKRKGPGTNTDDPQIEIVWSKNKSVWERISLGSRNAVVPTAVVLDTVIAKSDIVDFGARGYLSNWLPLYSTSSSSPNLIVLKNGDRTPPQISGKKYGKIAGFLKPYLSHDAQTVKIGESELLILVELDQSEPLAVGFDYQDLGLLVTFE